MTNRNNRFISLQIHDYLSHIADYELLVLYEDLISDPMTTCQKMFKVCGYNEEHIPKALEAMQKDSQRGAVVKRTTRSDTIHF
jgi:pimeloyl-CoA synthetase